MICEFLSDSPQATRELGQRIGAAVVPPAIILLEGELGAGKTLFTKGLYEGFGGKDVDSVVSPSYTLVHHYDAGGRSFYHVDLYRLENPDHILGLEYEEFLYLHTGLSVIEWPRSLRDLLSPDDYLEIKIAHGDNAEHRKFIFNASGSQYADALASVKSS